MKALLRPDEVAQVLNCSRRTVYRLVCEGELSALKVKSSLRIQATSVDSYVQRQISLFQAENGTSCDQQ